MESRKDGADGLKRRRDLKQLKQIAAGPTSSGKERRLERSC
jgi:hypothetical protein